MTQAEVLLELPQSLQPLLLLLERVELPQVFTILQEEQVEVLVAEQLLFLEQVQAEEQQQRSTLQLPLLLLAHQILYTLQVELQVLREGLLLLLQLLQAGLLQPLLTLPLLLPQAEALLQFILLVQHF